MKQKPTIWMRIHSNSSQTSIDFSQTASKLGDPISQTALKILLAGSHHIKQREKQKDTEPINGYKLLLAPTSSKIKQKRKSSSESTERNPNRGVRYFAQGTQTSYTCEKGSLGAHCSLLRASKP